MASKKASQPDPTSSIPAVIRRYRAYGECRELGIASISHGSILVEQLADGTFRLADDQGADEWAPAVLEDGEPAPAASVASTDASPATDAADAAESGVAPSESADTPA